MSEDKEMNGIPDSFTLDAVLGDGEYAVGIDKYCYALFQRVTRKRKATKEEYIAYENVGYFGTLSQVLKRYVDSCIKERVLKEKYIDTDLVCSAIKECHGKIEKAYGHIKIKAGE